MCDELWFVGTLMLISGVNITEIMSRNNIDTHLLIPGVKEAYDGIAS